jgi:hypothetical protein
MQKIVVLIISFVVFTDILIQISNTKSIEYNRRNFFRLRTFAINSLKTLRDIRKAQEMEQQIKKKAERQMAKAQEELQRNKENQRREKIQLHFGPSSFFKDFHTSRFF